MLKQVSRGQREPASQVARAKALLAVAEGQSFSAVDPPSSMDRLNKSAFCGKRDANRNWNAMGRRRGR